MIGLSWWLYSQNDERKIKKIISGIEKSLSDNQDTRLPQALKKTKSISRHFHPKVQMTFKRENDSQAFKLESKKALEGRLMYAMKHKYEIKNKALEIKSLKVESSSSASLKLDLKVQPPEGGEMRLLFDIHLVKEKGDWLFHHVAAEVQK